MRTLISFAMMVGTMILVSFATGHTLPVEYQADRAATAKWQTEFPPAVVDVRPKYDLTVPGEPLTACIVVFELVTDGHPALESFDSTDYTKEVFAFGGWGTKDDLEQVARDHDCSL